MGCKKAVRVVRSDHLLTLSVCMPHPRGFTRTQLCLALVWVLLLPGRAHVHDMLEAVLKHPSAILVQEARGRRPTCKLYFALGATHHQPQAAAAVYSDSAESLGMPRGATSKQAM